MTTEAARDAQRVDVLMTAQAGTDLTDEFRELQDALLHTGSVEQFCTRWPCWRRAWSVAACRGCFLRPGCRTRLIQPARDRRSRLALAEQDAAGERGLAGVLEAV
jgi:hypothetical protein